MNKKTTSAEKETKSVAKPAAKTTVKTIDPLYVIFEQHLFNFADPDSDRKTFIGQVVADYLSYLRKNNVIVPKSLEQPIVEELGTQVNTMLVRKINGCLTPNAFSDPTVSSRASKRRGKTRVARTG